MKLKIYLYIAMCFLPHSFCLAENQVIIFGGGFTPNNSQVSIEYNTSWILDIIKRHNSDGSNQLYYTDGNNTGVDVRKKNKALKSDFEPISRVYKTNDNNAIEYYSSKLTDNVKAADVDSIKNEFKRVFKNSKSGDNIFLIYQGHGGYDSSDTNNNYLKLWNNTRMTVYDLESLMSESHVDSTIRFIAPQCYSGSFSNLIYKNSKQEEGLAKNLRCGFVSQRENIISEGCTNSINTANYADYSSYFFAAIDGHKIDGSKLKATSDLNNDNQISLYEAHIYALINANSIDYSHASSEKYLINWQPWYLRWLPALTESDNIYNKVSQSIAEHINLDKQNNLIGNIYKLLSEKSAKAGSIKHELVGLEVDINALQNNIKKSLLMKWPELRYPYTEQFQDVLLNEISSLNAAIKNMDDYIKLVTLQNRVQALDIEDLHIQRNIVQINKILHMRKLSNILSLFKNYANEKEINEYKSLLSCEKFVI